MAMPNDDEMTEIAAPVTFLVLRANLCQLRRAADHIQISDATLEALEALLAETEAATRTLLLRTELPSEGDIDAVFDDEFLELAKAMRVDLFAWISQPEVAWRIGDPDAILSRWVDVLGADEGGEQEPMRAAAPLAERVAEMESSIRATFAILVKNHVI